MRDRLQPMRDDTGAMLVVALIIITTVAVVTGAVLAHGWTNFRTTVALRGVAGTSYAADTAAKVAINHLRLGSDAPGWTTPSFSGLWDDWVFTNNADGTGCFGAAGGQPDHTLELPGIYPQAGRQSADSSARVECSVVPGTGLFGPGTGVGVNNPEATDAFALALTTLGTTGTLQGMVLRPLGTGNEAVMPIRGGIASKSFITVPNGTLVTDGYVKAEGTCTGQIISNPSPACNAPGTVSEPQAPTSPLTTVPPYRKPSDYASSCVFQPGYYNNAKALSAATTGCPTARFASGTYYFDFNDENHGGQNVWEVTQTVIGGEYLGGAIPGACKSPIRFNGVTGVQFVFGGTSRMTVSDTAHVELCGPSNGGDAPVTLYQQQSTSTELSVPLPPTSALTVAQRTGDDGGTKWTTGTVAPVATPVTSVQAAIAEADISSVTWTIAGKNDDVGVDLRNFPGFAAIPAAADISSAELRVKYTKTSTQPLTATVNAQTPGNVVVSAPDATGWGTAQLKDQLSSAAASGAFGVDKPIIELRMMNADKSDGLTIDAVKLAVTYSAPALHKASDVEIVASPGGNFHGEFVVQGAAYVPNGFVRLDPGSWPTALVSFRWGLVARGVDFTAQPSQEFGYPLVSLPEVGTGLGDKVTVMDLKVYVCVEQSTCNSGGNHALTVRVSVTDPPYTAWGTGSGLVPRPEPGRRRIEVLSWAKQD